MTESLSHPTDALSYDEFAARFSAATQTLASDSGVNEQTKEQMNGVLHCLRVENPGHLRILQERIELDRDN